MLLNFFLYLLIGTSCAQVINICHVNKTDFCIGASIFSNSVDLNWKAVQIKSRINNQESDTTFRINWQLRNQSYYFASNKSTSIGSDDGFAFLRRGSDGFLMNKGVITLKTNPYYCLSILKCDRGVGGFCNPQSIYKVESVEDVKKGSYTAFKLCRDNDVSQTFAIDPPCAPQCTKEMLENDVCDQSCNYRTCFWDMGNCNFTYSPTRNPVTAFPTRKTTRSPTTKANVTTLKPTAYPTINPTQQPSLSPTEPTQEPTLTPTVEPTDAPTALPTFSFPDYEYFNGPYETYVPPPTESETPSLMPTSSPTTVPTFSPTMVPSSTPTNAPSSSPTRNPTNYPSQQPSTSPTVKPIKRPTRSSSPTNSLNTSSPTMNPTTVTPTVFFPLTASPTSVNNSNIQTFSPTSPGLNSGEIAGLSIGVIVLFFLFIYCCWFLVMTHQNKETSIKQRFLTWKAKPAPHSANMPDEDVTPPRRDSSPRTETPTPPINSPRAASENPTQQDVVETPVYQQEMKSEDEQEEDPFALHIDIPPQSNTS